MSLKLFGIEILGKEQKPDSIVAMDSVNSDSSIVIDSDYNSAGARWGMNTISGLSTDVAASKENDLITQYRELLMIPEVDLCVEEIVQEAVIYPKDGANAVNLNLDKLEDSKYSKKIKDAINDEFEYIYDLLRFNRKGQDIFKRWFVDSRTNYYKVIDNENPYDGIKSLTFIDPRKIKKVQESNRVIDKETGKLVINNYKEFFYYNEDGINDVSEARRKAEQSTSGATFTKNFNKTQQVSVLTKDSIAYAPSGINDSSGRMVIGYLHKALKTANNLQMMEDAMLIYKLSRAPERRVFYIDTGNLPKAKAEQYVKSISDQYKARVVYDSKTGKIKNDKKFNALTEDFWLPRSSGCFSMDTGVKLLDGSVKTIQELTDEYNSGITNWTYTVADNGHVVPGKITWAGVTKRNTEVIDVKLDNGEVITCTPEHKFILRTGERIRADKLTENMSLMPINTSTKKIAGKDYDTVQHLDTEEFEYTHRMVSRYFEGLQKKNSLIARENGYESVSAVIARNLDDEYVVQKRKNSNKVNHKVVSVTKRTDKMDVGTLTVDGKNEFHDYHNYALAAGVFVMNSKGTEISTLPGGAGSGDTEEVEYFKDKLYDSLTVPKSRFAGEPSLFSNGAQTTRDEIRFSRFIDRLRASFNVLFEEILGTQLILKNIIDSDEWEYIKNRIVYEYAEDNHYREAAEVERQSSLADMLQRFDTLTGKWVSREYVWKNIMKLEPDEIEKLKAEMDKENKEELKNQQELENSIVSSLDTIEADDIADKKDSNTATPTSDAKKESVDDIINFSALTEQTILEIVK